MSSPPDAGHKYAPARSVRVPDELWLDFLAVTEQRGDTPSDVIRAAITRYVRRHGRQA